MRRFISLVSAAALTAVAGLAAAAGPAQAVTGDYVYAGASGGTQINALGTTIDSGLTASSNLAGNTYPNSHSTEVAFVTVPKLVTVGAVTSGQDATQIIEGYQIVSHAETAAVNLLNGAITADALNTSATARVVDGVASAAASTKAVHLKIGNVQIPLNVSPNTKIGIPNIATVVINESRPIAIGGAAYVTGSALHVTLLKAQGGAPAGAEIYVNPVMARIQPQIPNDAQIVGGSTFGLFAGVGVGSSAKVLIQPAGVLSVPGYGTNGLTYTNNVAGVNVKNVATIGAVNTSMNATTNSDFADVTTQAEIAKVNLLNGVITADAIQATSHTFSGGGIQFSDPSFKFVNLTIAGKPISVNVAKNTLINVLGIAKIYLNQQISGPHSSTTFGLRIILSTAKYGLPIGAEIDVAYANSWIGTP